MQTKIVICTICPIGCNIKVTGNDKMVVSLENNKCKRGIPYATAEFLNPERILTTTIKINNYKTSVIPIRSNKPIPKNLIRDALKILKDIELKYPVNFGDIIIPNILNTGADIIVTGY